MNLIEEHMDLFTVGDDYYLAHCVASDMRLGAGIAVKFQKKFGLRGKIRASGESTEAPTCILTGRVFNLITKARSSGKPTYRSLGAALKVMRDKVAEKGVTKITMPKIGCGLDRLQWPKVREMLKETFENMDVEILVCVWK